MSQSSRATFKDDDTWSFAKCWWIVASVMFQPFYLRANMLVAFVSGAVLKVISQNDPGKVKTALVC